jgi:ribose/xylose/arabinose/galactoside ABC-type transport system permease subunit
VGAYTLAIGSNENAARNSGISINLYRSLPFLLSGFSMAVGSVVLVSRVLWISPGLGGTPLLLDVIAANIIGGVRVSGGRGRIWGVLVGSLVVAIINNAVNIIKIGPQWYDGFKGLIIIVMIVVNRLLEDVRK